MASARFMRKLRLLTRIYDVPLIFDEVQTGWGMTGRLWAHELFDLPCPPDVVTWAKKAQNGVLFVSEELATFFQEEKKFNTTWEGDSVGMVRLLALLDKLKQYVLGLVLLLPGSPFVLLPLLPRHAGRGLEADRSLRPGDPQRLRRLTTLPYLTAGVVACLAALCSPLPEGRLPAPRRGGHVRRGLGSPRGPRPGEGGRALPGSILDAQPGLDRRRARDRHPVRAPYRPRHLVLRPIVLPVSRCVTRG